MISSNHPINLWQPLIYCMWKNHCLVVASPEWMGILVGRHKHCFNRRLISMCGTLRRVAQKTSGGLSANPKIVPTIKESYSFDFTLIKQKIEGDSFDVGLLRRVAQKTPGGLNANPKIVPTINGKNFLIKSYSFFLTFTLSPTFLIHFTFHLPTTLYFNITLHLSFYLHLFYFFFFLSSYYKFFIIFSILYFYA